MLYNNFSEILNLCKIIEQNNPYIATSIQHILWNNFASKNIPFLIVASNEIKKIYDDCKIATILFTTRDCVFLKQLFNHLYPDVNTKTFYCSRALYLFPSSDYMAYCSQNLTEDALVIDLQGTGQSFKNLSDELNLKPWYLLVHWNSKDRAPYYKSSLKEYAKKIIIREFSFYNDSIEKLNIDLVGTYFDFINNKPISYVYEYDTIIVGALHESFKNLLENLHQADIYKLKECMWNNDFNLWMDINYNTANTRAINWVHTHFEYTKNFIEEIRRNYVS